MDDYKKKAFLFGKEVEYEVRDGVRYINGMTVSEFSKTLTPEERKKAFLVGLAAIKAEKKDEEFSEIEMYDKLSNRS